METDVDTGYRRVASGPQSVLGATLLGLGSEQHYVEAATGLPVGLHDYRFASDAHAVSTEDAERISEIVTARGGSAPAFWTDYVRRCTTGADRLLEKLRSLAKTGEHPPEPAQLLDGLTEFAEAMKAMAPFILVTPLARPVLESALAEGFAEQRGGPHDSEVTGQLIARLTEAWQESEARSEVR